MTRIRALEIVDALITDVHSTELFSHEELIAMLQLVRKLLTEEEHPEFEWFVNGWGRYNE